MPADGSAAKHDDDPTGLDPGIPSTGQEYREKDRIAAQESERYPCVWRTGDRRGDIACRIIGEKSMFGFYKIAFPSPDGPWEDTRYIKYVFRGDRS